MRRKRSSPRCHFLSEANNFRNYICGTDRFYTMSTFKRNIGAPRDECEAQGWLLVKVDTLDAVEDILFMDGRKLCNR